MKTIENYYEEFQRENRIKGLSQATIDFYQHGFRYFASFLEARSIKDVSQLNKHIVGDYIIHLRDYIQNMITINCYLRTVRRFIAYLSEQKVIEGFKVCQLRTAETVKEVLSNHEVDTILNLRHFDKPHLISLLLLATGIRAASLINLKVRDIDFDNNIIMFTKTKNRRLLSLPLTAPIVKLLANYIHEQQLPSHSYVFLNSKDGKYTRHTLWRVLEKFHERCGINKTGIHIYRHTFSKLMVLKGCDAFTLQRWLMHSTMQQSKNYVNLYGNDLALTLNIYNPTANILV